ncbi:MAG: aspartyl-phosphate phosphatase Spo0E family protein, partial [Zhenhengia sp.]
SIYSGGIDMNTTTKRRIVDLQIRLNSLVENSNDYTDHMRELYTISTELDELIVQYYKEYTA